MTLVTFAVPFESAAFRRLPVAGAVRLVHTGVGPEAARVALEMALCAERPDRVIAAGFAGALNPGIAVGRIVTDTAGNGGRLVTFAHADEVVATAEGKRALRHATGADVVDMETTAIREVCAAAEVPVMALRAISDGAEDDLGLPPEVLRALADAPWQNAPRLGWTLLTNGERRRGFLRLIRDCRTAQDALAAALEREISGSSGW